MLILGIESSCDETGVALYHGEHGLVAEALHSQVAQHQHFGGVVPELAARDHLRYLSLLVHKVLTQSGYDKTELSAVAYTAGPGLIGALLTGACFAKSLSFGLNIPALAVHHLEAHLLAAQLEELAPSFPFLALLVSGGHTQLIEARGLGEYLLLGDTLDDAVGEAFDKTAKLLGFPYPGGAALADLAQTCDLRLSMRSFPRPMTERPGLNFSFSGLKTHALIAWNTSLQDEAAKTEIAWQFQQAVVDTLCIKCQRALEQTGLRQLVVAGGVGANQLLRERLKEMMRERQGKAFFPRLQYCTDNGAMIAYAGYLYALKAQYDTSLSVEVKARWPISQ